MKDLFIVSKFTIKDMIKRKSFIISTIILCLFVILGFNIPKIINSISNGNASTKLLIVDKDNLFEDSLKGFDATDYGYKLKIENREVTKEELKEKIEAKKIDEAILIDKEEDVIKITYVIESIGYISDVPQDIIDMLTSIYTNIQIGKLNLTTEQLESITPNFTYDIMQTSEDEAEGNIFVFMLLSIVLFYAVYFNAYQVSSAITTEKTSKIIETLVTSTTPKTIVLGKTIGIGIVGLLQMVLLVLVAIISKTLFLEPGILDEIINFDNFTPLLGIITIIYFILGYSFYALLYALTGSTVSKPEDIQSANGPIAIISLIGFYIAYFTMMNPASNLNKFAALLPISSPFCMPCRIMMGLGTPAEVILSILILLLTSILVAYISIKIYSQAILNYGTKLSLKDMFKMFKNKNY